MSVQSTKNEFEELEESVDEMIRRLESLYENMDKMTNEELLDEYSKIFLDHPTLPNWDI